MQTLSFPTRVDSNTELKWRSKFVILLLAGHQIYLSNGEEYSGICRAEVRRSFITTTAREESQVTPQGRHRWGSNCMKIYNNVVEEQAQINAILEQTQMAVQNISICFH